MRDIWLAPPGDDGSTRRNQRKKMLRAVALHVTIFALFLGSVTYAAMRHSTAVSTKDAIAEFRASVGDDDAGTKTNDSSNERKEARDRSKGRTTRAGDRSTERESGDREAQRRSPDAADASEATVAAPTGDSTTETAPHESAPNEAAPQENQSAPHLPPEGVYEWSVDGIERAPGVERRMPSRSHRLIQHTGADSWTEHHIFSEEKEMWFGLLLTDGCVATKSSRNRVVMGPVTADKTVTFDPVAIASRTPYELGRTWKGSWSGKTSGTYTGRTFEHTWLNIGGERVEVWGSEIVMTMHGEVEGNVITRTWVSPKYSLAVKQYQKTNVESGPGSYFSEWTGQTLTLNPRT
jgi:hypothetical protein